MNFIVMYADSKFVCLQKYEFPYDFDEKYVLKTRWGPFFAEKSRSSAARLAFRRIENALTCYEAMSFHEDNGREPEDDAMFSSGSGNGRRAAV